MRAIWMAMAAALISGAVWAQNAGKAIENVISSQLEAFQADDFTTAFTYASPLIKRMFGTPEVFGEMVRRGYPMVWRPGSVEFAGVRELTGKTYQKVLITDQAGKLHVLEYEMLETGDSWEINGVRFLRDEQFGA